MDSEETEDYVMEKSEKEEQESNGVDDGLSQLRQEGSLLSNNADIEDLDCEAVRQNLVKDHVEDVRVNSSIEEPSVKEMDSVKEIAVSEIVPVGDVEVENPEKVETSTCLTVLPDPSFVKPSLSSEPCLSVVSSPTTQEQKSIPRAVNNFSVSPVLRTPSRDGYNWRKYGQKQVKSPKGSRSYYRCTYYECCAKKIECSNHSGNVIEIVNKGFHSHEPPRKNNVSPREIRPISSTIPPVKEDKPVVQELAIVPSGLDTPAPTKESQAIVVEQKRHCANVAADQPEPKRRLKKDNFESSDSVSKPVKKHKFVVHAAGDVGISGDGYRWRKYGQKMVKGNPNPRNYYRCTSAGCPVRKHIESSVENTRALIITYKGVHNHDTPVPKRRHGPPSSTLVAAAAPTSMRTRPDEMGRGSEKVSEGMEVSGGEKAVESAKTLLSIGFEIKQC